MRSRVFSLFVIVAALCAACDVFYPPLTVRDPADGGGNDADSYLTCDGAFVIPSVDNQNCGACGNVCPASAPICLGGRCCQSLVCR